MRTRTLGSALISVCLLGSAGVAHAQQKIPWARSLAAALARAKAANKLVMADFSTVW